MHQISTPVTLRGITKPFEGNGRKLGFPTANIEVSTNLQEGVYFGFASLGKHKQQPALIFVGVPITVGAKNHRIEAHLLDIADRDYYEQRLELTIQYFHRPNQHFDSVNDLRTAMSEDEKAIRAWIALGNS